MSLADRQQRRRRPAPEFTCALVVGIKLAATGGQRGQTTSAARLRLAPALQVMARRRP
jgi:hypothetical protein